MNISAPVKEVTEIVKGEIEGSDQLMVKGFAMIDLAGEGDLTFIGDSRHAKKWATSNATVALIDRDLKLSDWDHTTRAVIRVENADHAMISVLHYYAEPMELPEIGIHETAVVHPSAVIGKDVRIGPCVVIDANCVLGEGTSIESGVRLYRGVQLGNTCRLNTGVVIYDHCVIKDRVALHANVVIGADGFGYRPCPEGNGLLQIPHIGNVVIESDVEIGANSCIDRGKFGATHIGQGTKVDNLCQIGHNCSIGRSCAISGHSGIAGSTIIGDGTFVGGGAGIADHMTIGSGVRIGAGSGVMNDIPDGETWAGFPAKESRKAMKEQLALRNLPEWSRRIKKLLDST